MTTRAMSLSLLAAIPLALGCGEPKASSAGQGGSTTTASGGGGNEGSSGLAGAQGHECQWSSAGAGGAGLECSSESSAFASHVVDHAFGPGQSAGQDQFPQWVLGAPQGAGCCQGAVGGVVSLGNGGWVVLGFRDNAIVDEPGPDFIVFENAFWVGGNQDKIFAELASVAVSEDGDTWFEFPCRATQPPFDACAGWRPTLANPEDNDIDPTDPEVAGGNAFDLSDVCLKQARFVRITDRADLNDPLDGVFDLDAVSIVHPLCPSEAP